MRGKVYGCTLCQRCDRDHPRLCGEKDGEPPVCLWKRGSPPPMRGKGRKTGRRKKLIGITPAYAGKSTIYKCPEIISKDHPRLCGEKITQSPTQNTRVGSPPPMRGKVVPSGCFGFWSRITPAYAGKSIKDKSGAVISRDHPRLCGEKDLPPVYSCQHAGSPPPMRGKAPRGTVLPDAVRITPAYAGKRNRVHIDSATTRDHPRLCGEKFLTSCYCIH